MLALGSGELSEDLGEGALVLPSHVLGQARRTCSPPPSSMALARANNSSSDSSVPAGSLISSDVRNSGITPGMVIGQIHLADKITQLRELLIRSANSIIFGLTDQI